MWLSRNAPEMPTAHSALPGRADQMQTGGVHLVSGHAFVPPFPTEMQTAVFGMGCFWGAERAFWTIPGVWSTAVGYAGGFTPNPTYEEVCSGRTGHAEVVLVVFDPSIVTYAELLKAFWEAHDPTQGMAQGNDVGTQYRSVIYPFDEAQRSVAEASRDAFARELEAAGYGVVTTEISLGNPFFYAEDYHQQYLERNPGGYCGLAGTGVSCPVGLAS